MFTAREGFDLLQDAMSVVCGPKMCVFRRVHIVYSSECASVSLSQSHVLPPVCVCACALLSVLFMWCCVHTRLVCVCVCNVNLLGWRQD